MDAGIVAIIAALIAAFPPTITAVANARASKRDNKATRAQIERVSKAVEHTEEELRKQGEILVKQERAFEERKRHEELQNELALANMTSTQVILDSLHASGLVNGQCEQQRSKLKELEHKMAAQALHLNDDDIRY